MEESGVTKLITVRIENEELALSEGSPSQSELWDENGRFADEDVPPEEGRELPIGINDPKKVTPEQLRPIRAKRKSD
jgi:chromosome segregation protein